METEKIKIEYLNINEIKPYKFNPRKNEKAISIDADSIRQFGFLVPVVIDKNNELIAGHTRIEAGKLLGMEEIPAIKVENLTEEQIRAFRIMDNKSTEYARWDRILLKHEFEFLRSRIDMKFTGFREAEIMKIMGEDTKDSRGNRLGKYQIEPNKVYVLGNHRLICADATDPMTYTKLIPPKTEMQCVYTDPPYGVSYSGTNNENGREWDVIAGDQLRGDDLFNLLSKAFKEINPYLSKDSALYVFHASATQMIFERALNYAGFKVKQQLIWEKHHVLGHSHYHWNHEPIFYCARNDETPRYYGTRDNKTVIDSVLLNPETISKMEKEQLQEVLKEIVNNSTVQRFNKDATKDYIHPTQKPTKMGEFYIVNSTKMGDNVLDLFAGSGSTLIACENKKRKCFAVEIDQNFVSLIIERWEALTGNHAISELKEPMKLR
jgi:site-specific DNA-methyltransferase (adenine-specific)